MAVPIDGEPYDASFLTDGIGIERPLPGVTNLAAAGTAYGPDKLGARGPRRSRHRHADGDRRRAGTDGLAVAGCQIGS